MKELTSPSGKKIVINEFLTPREQRKVDNFAATICDYKADGFDKEGKPKLTPKFSNPDGLSEWQDIKIKAVVVSIDGQTDRILDKLLDLTDGCTKADYDFVIDECAKVIAGEYTKKK